MDRPPRAFAVDYVVYPLPLNEVRGGRRERVMRRLREAEAYHVTLLVASEGFGKSTALTHYLNELDEPWLRCDAGSDHDPALLAAWLRERVSSFQGVVVVDALDCDDCGQACAEEVAAAVERHGANVRWIITSRTSRALPIGSWLVYGEAGVPIDETVLRLTSDEARDAAALDETTFERIYAATAGWPAAFAKAAEASAGERESCADVYDLLSEPERELLGVGAALPQLDVELLELAGCSGASGTLAGLFQRLPQMGVAGDRAAARLLEYALEHGGSQERASRYVRGGDALAAAGRTLLALAAYARVGAAQQIFDLLKAHGVLLIEQGHAAAIDTALSNAAAVSFARNPATLGLRAYIESSRGRYREAATLYRQALLAATDDANMTATMAARFAAVLINLGEDPTTILEGPANDPALPLTLRAEALALLAVARARFKNGDVRPALDELEPIVMQIDDVARVQTMHAMGAAAILSGDTRRASRLLGAAAELAS